MKNLLAFGASDLNQIETKGVPGFNFTGGQATLGAVISAVLPYIFAIAGLLLLLFLISSGLSYMTSRGDPKATAAAQARITYALVGFLIIFLAFFIAQAAGLILGLPALKDIFSGRLI